MKTWLKKKMNWKLLSWDHNEIEWNAIKEMTDKWNAEFLNYTAKFPCQVHAEN